jgi:hypothetical protein
MMERNYWMCTFQLPGGTFFKRVTKKHAMKQTTTLKKCFTAPKRTLKTMVVATLLLCSFHNITYAQNNQRKPIQHQQLDENYGNTLNLGVGIAYYGYLGGDVPIIFANYEFNVARSFTLAPFIGFSSYRSYNDYHYNGYNYYYHETIIPVGVKGTYYFDKLLGAGPKWDFYLAASLGFVYDNIVWDNGYNGDRNLSRRASPLYLDGHIGAEYHCNKKIGIFLDLSTGVSTIGIAIHGRN